jgi:hypothetical protein
MNPFHWKHEHQVALLLASVVGALAGEWFFGRPIFYCVSANTDFSGTVYWTNAIVECSKDLVVGPGLGGFIEAAIIYIRQLTRA